MVIFRTMLFALVGIVALAFSGVAHAGWAFATDASVLKPYVHLSTQKVYIPGLNPSNPAWTQTATTAYYIDVNTPTGQAAYALLLTQIAQKGKIRFYKTDSTTAGPIVIVAVY